MERFDPAIETERWVGDQPVENAVMEPWHEGDWVRYSDAVSSHRAILEGLAAEIQQRAALHLGSVMSEAYEDAASAIRARLEEEGDDAS